MPEWGKKVEYFARKKYTHKVDHLKNMVISTKNRDIFAHKSSSHWLEANIENKKSCRRRGVENL